MPKNRTKNGTLKIGTSGWNYSHWRRVFYPKGTPQSSWLEYYSRRFDTVEINATFYRLPKPEYVERWRQAVPEDFIFSVKGSRYLTHIKRLGDTGESVDRFFDLIERLGPAAGPTLWQLPPNMKRNDDRLAAFAGSLPGDRRHTFEFRHPSWFCQEVYDILANAGMALCIADHPERPEDRTLTAGWTYIRLHYGGRDGLYSSEELKGWAGFIRDLTGLGHDVFVYFNNDWKGYAIENAVDLCDLTGIPVKLEV